MQSLQSGPISEIADPEKRVSCPKRVTFRNRGSGESQGIQTRFFGVAKGLLASFCIQNIGVDSDLNGQDATLRGSTEWIWFAKLLEGLKGRGWAI